MKKAILFCDTDGHGVTMGSISARNLRAAGYEVELICRWPQTGRPSQFWGETFLRQDFGGCDLIVTVDIPLPEFDGTFPTACHDAIQKIAELEAAGAHVAIVDHHKVAETRYGLARTAGAEVLLTSAAPTCFWGNPSGFAEKWGRLGATCDRDDSVLPITAEEKALAEGIDAAIRKDLAGAIAAIEADNTAYFADCAGLPQIPGEVEVTGQVVLATETTPQWGFKQLSNLAEQAGADYAVGIDCYNSSWRVIAITNWQSNALPVALKLGLTRFIGHGAAILVPVCSAEDADGRAKALVVARDFVERLGAVEVNSADEADLTKNGLSLFGYVSAFMRRVHVPFFMTLHGWGHVEHVVGHARSLGSLFNLSEHEQRLLDWSALFHDVGNGASTIYGVDESEARARHHEFTAKMIEEWRTEGLFQGIMPGEDIIAVADLCLRHRKKMPLPTDPRMRLLCVILRVADGMDIDARRAQKNDEGRFYEELDLPEDSRPHWEGHRAIEALRLAANHGLVFEIIVTNRAKAAFQVAEITQELSCLTEFCDWSVRVTSADGV